MRSASIIRFVIPLVVLLGLLPGRADARPDGEFPDAWYFYGSKRPAQLHAMEGNPAPELHLKDWLGEPQDLEALRGKVVVIDFWATWCGPCRKSLPKNVRLVEEYGEQGVVMIGVHDAARGAEKMPALAEDAGINYPLAVDDQRRSQRAWKVRFWPTYFVLDRKGVVRAAGLRPERVDGVVARLLAEAPGAPPARPKYEVILSNSRTADAPPAPKGQPVTPGKIEDAWLEGSPQQRRSLSRLTAGGTPPAIESDEWVNCEPLGLDELKGKVVLLDFWGVWCGPCLASIPKMNSLHEKYADEGLVIIGVCDRRKVERMAAVVAERGISYPVCADRRGAMTAAYRVNGFPDYYFIDRSGALRAADVKNAHIEDAIRSLLAEEAPAADSGG